MCGRRLNGLAPILVAQIRKTYLTGNRTCPQEARMGGFMADAPDSKLTNTTFTMPQLAAFAAASAPAAMLGLPLVVYLPHHFTNDLGVPLAWAGLAFGAVRIIDVFLDPAIGLAIDATNTPFGRFRAWMAAAVPVLMLGVYMMFMANPGISVVYVIGWLLVLYGGFSMVVLGHSAWAAALAPRYHQRSRIYGVMQATGVVGTVAGLLVNAQQGLHAMGWLIIAAIPICVATCAMFVHEPRRIEVSERLGWRDYWSLLARPSMLRILGSDLALALGPAITAALYLYFFTLVLGYTAKETNYLLLLYIFAGIVGAPFWAQIAKRLGKHRTVMLACVLYGLAQALVFVIPRGSLTFMIPSMFFAGFVVSAFTFLIRAMVADVGDEVRLDIGKDRTALLFALITSTSKVGSALAPAITFPILQFADFKVGAEAVKNSAFALDALSACYVIVPVLTMFVGALLLRGYRLDSTRHDAIREELRIRDEALQGVESTIESLTGGTMTQAPALGLKAPS